MEVDDLILVYKDTTPLILEGGVCKIIDKSGDDPDTFLAVKLEDVGQVEYRYRHDPNAIPIVLMSECGIWVKKENLQVLSLEEPKPWWRRIF